MAEQQGAALGGDTISVGDISQSTVAIGAGAVAISNTYYQVQAAPPPPDRERAVLLDKLRRKWVDGFLAAALPGGRVIDLQLRARPDAVRHAFNEQYQELRATPPALGNTIFEVFMAASGALLILGAPGAGKTVLLCDLCRALLEQAASDAQHPIPVILNLSSWGKQATRTKRPLTFEQWLATELHDKYGVSSQLTRRWLEANMLLLLLDGLDEVDDEQRAACVAAINAFRGAHGLIALAVCSREAPYDELLGQQVALALEVAVVVQPLSAAQIDKALAQAGVSLGQLGHDPLVRELLASPLMLDIVADLQRDKPGQLRGASTAHALVAQIFDDYIGTVFARRGTDTRYAPAETIRRLAWLAQRMMQGESQLLVEHIQRPWLAPRQGRVYVLLVWLALLVLSVLLVGVPLMLFLPPPDRLLGPIFGVFIGLVLCLIFGTLLNRPIQPVEQLRLSWWGSLAALAAGISGILLGAWVSTGDERRFTAVLFGQLATLVVWLRWGLVRGVIDRRERPNQGILRSLRLGLTGAGAVLLVGLLNFVPTYAFSAQPLSFGNALLYSCTLALAGGLSLGGFAALRHYTLRWLLARGGQLPLNLVPFLDYCTERILLRRVGGSYLFVHRLLLEHIAQLDDDHIKRLVDGQPGQPLS